VNDYLHAAGGEAFSAKDFRTWHATVSALETLARLRFETQSEAKTQVKETLCAIAKRLGNTPAMCRKCYVHPGVLKAFLAGDLAAWGEKGASRERLLQYLKRVSRTPDAQAAPNARKPRGTRGRPKLPQPTEVPSYKQAA
jgi:DNA topoisomerase-1